MKLIVMVTERPTPETHYRISARNAKEQKRLGKECCTVTAPHDDPSGRTCPGDILVKLRSWSDAPKSPDIKKFGLINGMCTLCGSFVILDAKKRVVKSIAYDPTLSPPLTITFCKQIKVSKRPPK